jgi:hypothetical protein
VRQHEAVESRLDGFSGHTAADVARGQGAQFSVELLAGHDATDQLGITARFAAAIADARAASAPRRGARRPDRDPVQLVEAIDRLAVDDFDPVRGRAVEVAEVITLTGRPAFTRKDAAIKTVEAA